MTDRQKLVLNGLRLWGPCTVWSLSRWLNMPASKVNRTLKVLSMTDQLGNGRKVALGEDGLWMLRQKVRK